MSEEAALRARWRQLVEEELPAAAAHKRWPVRFDHCFARILLDNALNAPWRTVVKAPAWRHMPPDALADAIALGEAALRDEADLHALHNRSLVLRGKRPR